MTNRPHICFISDTLHTYFGSGIEPGTGGAERQQYMLATGLRDLGYEISIATLDYDQARRDRVNRIDVWRVIPDVRGVPRAPYKAWKTIRGLREIDADVYYVRGNDLLCMIAALHTSLADASFVYAVANDANVDPELLARQGVFRHPFLLAMRTADRVVAQTHHQQELLISEHDVEAPRIPNGYEIPEESEVVPHSDRGYVLWVGSMDPTQKRPDRFLDLARELPDVPFRMIGPPDNDAPGHFDEIETEAADIPNLEFLGFVDPHEIHEHYRSAIALVNTSDYEGFPNVFLEAWRYATPVVSLYHSLDGVLDEQPVGTHAGSMDALVDAVDHISSDVSLRQELGDGGREHMIENYSFDQLLDRYERVFEEVYQESRS
ncbi:glycosyltransferase family 4 protein [Halalkaliarchaeum sp. AArc-GB]|uniref:glycosyltransferase family 4 protein n=1 Tax=Halalkaliarchaeum sp. AArc-GB TaxID=3074078 RepID=UPI002855B8EC|nr:glycosyltransferase family 4 protein [Halalkaliarchaeum sp. AArc-GB]MDR5674238.1 glycosyltransferase family 4 protein [Halalkaliarchaeum sp. AArc-GB]